MPSRGQFLSSVSAAAFVSRGSVWALAATPDPEVFNNASLGAYAQHLLTYERFQALKGTTFMVFLERGRVAYLQLEQVTRQSSAVRQTLRGRKPAPTLESITLAFRGRGPKFGQDSYLVDHGQLGRFAMFLVPGQVITGPSTDAEIICSAGFSSLVETNSVTPVLQLQP